MWKLLILIWFVPLIGPIQSARRVEASERARRSIENFPLGKRTFGEKTSSIEQTLHFTKDERCVKQAQEKTSKGHTKVRCYETYKGIKIYDTLVTFDLDNPTKGVTGSIIEDIDEKDIPSVKPKIFEDQAFEIATRNAGLGTTYKIYNSKIDLLILYKDGKAKLCYYLSFMHMVNIGGEVKPSRLFYFINAITGEVVESWQGLTNADVIGDGGNAKTGFITYGQNNIAPLNLMVENGECIYEDDDILVINLEQDFDLSITTPYSSSCPYNVVGSPDTINGGISAANDAFYYGKATKNMFRDWYDKDVLGDQIQLKIHLGHNYTSAFWDGDISVIFGDGNSSYYPIISLDIVAHEISHGFTEQNSGLQYEFQSGGINEAFSDMAGEAAEYFVDGTNDWKVGFDVLKSANGALRYMNDPPLDGRSIDHADDYDSSMDQHYSSGVYNKAFYILANIPEWNTKKAFDVFVRANILYWSATTNFIQGACGVLQAAYDLNYSTEDVLAAFETVGVVPETSCVYGEQVVTLLPFVSRDDLSAGTNGETELYFMITIPQNSLYLLIETKGTNGNLDLYVKFNVEPTLGSYDFVSNAQGSDEMVYINSPTAGNYYIMLYAYSAFTQATITAYTL